MGDTKAEQASKGLLQGTWRCPAFENGISDLKSLMNADEVKRRSGPDGIISVWFLLSPLLCCGQSLRLVFPVELHTWKKSSKWQILIEEGWARWPSRIPLFLYSHTSLAVNCLIQMSVQIFCPLLQGSGGCQDSFLFWLNWNQESNQDYILNAVATSHKSLFLWGSVLMVRLPKHPACNAHSP